MLRSEAAGADSLGGCKCFDFYLWLDRSVLVITSVRFPGNSGMQPQADSLRAQRAQDAPRRVETARAKAWDKEENGQEWEGDNDTEEDCSGLIIHRQFA